MYVNITTNLMVESVDETLAFYQNILGFSVVASVDNGKGGLQFAIVEKNGLNLMFQERTNFIAEYPILDTQNVQPSVSLFIRVDNFSGLYQELTKKGQILTELHETFYGSKEFAVADNNGYVLTFTRASGLYRW